MRWFPHVTVAAIVERQGRFLMVKENIEGEIVYNQPAGHLEAHETLVEAIIREVAEETAWQFCPTGVVGLYRMHIADKNTTYIRACFTGDVHRHNPDQQLDDGIIEAIWMDKQELVAHNHALRSPLVLSCINDYLKGQCFNMDILKDIGNV